MADIIYKDLVYRWREGLHDEVVELLMDSLPHITALFIAQGIADGVLRSAEDVNEVANRMMDQFLSGRGI